MSTIPGLLARSVERFSMRSALLEPATDGSMSELTYKAFQEKVQGFAGYLQQQHFKKDDRLLLWSASGIEWLIIYMGTLTLGGVIVPLDVNSKEDFIQKVAKVTHAKILITTEKQYKTLKETELVLLDIEALPAGTLDKNALPEILPDDLAQIIFTSGTTGNPKGVMLTHNNITSNVEGAAAVVDIRPTDRALSILPLSHMFELTIEVALLYCGASIVYSRTLVPDTLLKLLSTQHVTCMALVPQALQLFLNGIERTVRQQKRERQWELLHRVARYIPFSWRKIPFQAVHSRFGGHFRFFFSGGAYLAPMLANKWEGMGFKIIQGYGATECSPIITATPPKEHNLASVGRALPGVEVRIADDKEILARGPNVSPGYLDNPEATALSFHDGWYHTGDLGELDAQNNLYLKGRKKNIIVLSNGLNVYPEDIENVLSTMPGIKDVVVIGLDKDNQGPEVHAIVLTDEPEQVKASIQQANKRLASHQQIKGSTIWPDKDFPRTHTMKVKRQDVLSRIAELRKK